MDAMIQAQGWYRDPFDRHEDRYFSVGSPTKLVRDNSVESYDPPPQDEGMPMPLLPVVARENEGRGVSDMRRADELQRAPRSTHVGRYSTP
jgi:hypothetical protein